jgi:hypothetical protein
LIGSYLLAGIPDKAGAVGLGSVVAFQRPDRSDGTRGGFSGADSVGVNESEAELYGQAIGAAVSSSGDLLLLVVPGERQKTRHCQFWFGLLLPTFQREVEQSWKYNPKLGNIARRWWYVWLRLGFGFVGKT